MLRSATALAVRRGRVIASSSSAQHVSSSAPIASTLTASSTTTRSHNSSINASFRSIMAMSQRLQSCRFSSSETDVKRRSTMYAAVDHGEAYEEAIASRHGDQLRLAYDEGRGKDDPPYDPFALLLDEPEEEDEEGGIDGVEHDEGEGGEDKEVEDEEESKEAVDAAWDEPLEDEGASTEISAEEEEEYEDRNSDDNDESGLRYTNQGFVKRPKSQLVALKSGLPAGGLFAVLQLPGTQQKVTVDDVIVVNKLRPVDMWAVGKTITLKDEDIVLAGSTHFTLVGLPGVSGVEVDLLVEEITRDAKVLVFKKRKRKHSRRLNGFRREVTILRVMDIRVPEQYERLDYKETVS